MTELGLAGLAIIWGANFSVIKVALAEIPPLAFNALRFPLAAAFLLAIVGARSRRKLPERQDVARIVILGLLGNVLYQVVFIYGMALTRAGNASLMLATSPVWTILLSYAIGHERPAPRVWAGILAALVGMLLVVAGGDGVELATSTLPGDALMITASMGWSVYTVGSRDLIQRYGPVLTTAWTLWVGTAGVVLIGLPDVLATPLGDISALAWVGIVYAGLLAITVAYLLWYRGVQQLGNARTAVYSNLVPVVALTVAWLWLGERPGALQLAGAAVILGGVSIARSGGSGRAIPRGAGYGGGVDDEGSEGEEAAPPLPSSRRTRTSGNS